MTDITTAVFLACAPVAGFATFTFAESADAVTPWIAGFAVVIFTSLMAPIVKWMMRRMDGQSKEAADAAARRERREDDRQEAFEQQVAALGGILSEIKELNSHHIKMDAARVDAVKDILEAINGIPEKVNNSKKR